MNLINSLNAGLSEFLFSQQHHPMFSLEEGTRPARTVQSFIRICKKFLNSLICSKFFEDFSKLFVSYALQLFKTHLWLFISNFFSSLIMTFLDIVDFLELVRFSNTRVKLRDSLKLRNLFKTTYPRLIERSSLRHPDCSRFKTLWRLSTTLPDFIK